MCYKVPRSPHATYTRHNMDKNPSRAISEFAARRLNECEAAWRGGSLPAVADAIKVCNDCGQVPPAWLVEAIHALVTEQMRVRSGGGGFNSEQAKFDENMKHYMRWDMVKELCDRHVELYESSKHHVEALRRDRAKLEARGIDLGFLDDPDCIIDAAKKSWRRRMDYAPTEAWQSPDPADGASLKKAFAIVARHLEGTPDACSADTVEYSYYLVEKRMAEGHAADFYVPDFIKAGK
jgi:hypothetical protein